MQNFSYMHKSDGDIKNDRINEEKTQEKSVSIPRLDTNPDAKSITVSDNANRWQNSNTSPSPKTLSAGTNQANTENTDRTDHRTGMPSDGTLPRTGTPMDGSTPRTGMPSDDTLPRTGTPMNGSTPRTGMPSDDTLPRTGTPMNGPTPRTGMPMNGTLPRTGTPMNGTTPRTGMPMNGTLPRTGTPMNGSTPRTGMPMNGTLPRTGTPMNDTTPRTGMPMNGTLPRTGTPMNGSTPPTGMPQNNISPETPNMPQSYLPYGSLNYVPLPKVTPYNTPMGIPLYPLYGYDNCEDLDRDLNYLKQLYPNTAKRIQKEIDEECDKLEYDGSVMFDEYPDKVTLEKIIDRVYEKVKDLEEAPQVEINSYFYPPRNRQNLLRDLVTIILLNEIFNRRRRYRSRRRWF